MGSQRISSSSPCESWSSTEELCSWVRAHLPCNHPCWNQVKQLCKSLSRSVHEVCSGLTFHVETPVWFSILGWFHGNNIEVKQKYDFNLMFSIPNPLFEYHLRRTKHIKILIYHLKQTRRDRVNVEVRIGLGTFRLFKNCSIPFKNKGLQLECSVLVCSFYKFRSLCS